MNARLPALLAFSVLWNAQVLAGQSPPPRSAPVATYKLLALKVTGSERYTEKELLPASGLQLGESVGEADFKEAVRRLGDSGFFTDVAYTYSYSAAGARLELQVKDADSSTLVPAHFENFVWFSDGELLHQLQLRIPLFKDKVPIGGSLADRLEAALQEVLDEKKIPARVDYLRESGLQSEHLTGIAYSVEAMDIHVRGVEFPGATPDLVPGLQAAARRLAGARYMRSPIAHVASADYLPVCLKHGYLKASFAQAEARIVSQAAGEVEVDVILALTPGKTYLTSGVEWKSNSVLKTDDLQPLLHLPIGQPADAVQLVADLENAVKLYRSHGYMIARVMPKPALDDEKSTVRYELVVAEGPQFKMGELEIRGLDSQATARLQASWKIAPGDPYNGEYAKQFLDQTRQMLPRGVPWDVNIHEAVNESDNTVDLTLRFTTR